MNPPDDFETGTAEQDDSLISAMDDDRYYEDGVYAQYFPDDNDMENDPESIVIIDDHKIRLHLHPKARESTLRWFARLNSLIHNLEGRPYYLNRRIEIMLHKMWEGTAHLHAGKVGRASEYQSLNSPGAERLLFISSRWLESPFEAHAKEPRHDSGTVYRIRPGVWQMVQSQWGYPTVVGLHDELTEWVRGLDDLQKRISETISFMPRDIERESTSRGFDIDPESALFQRLVGVNQDYTRQILEAIEAAQTLIKNASGAAISRFST